MKELAANMALNYYAYAFVLGSEGGAVPVRDEYAPLVTGSAEAFVTRYDYDTVSEGTVEARLAAYNAATEVHDEA